LVKGVDDGVYGLRVGHGGLILHRYVLFFDFNFSLDKEEEGFGFGVAIYFPDSFHL
jgi:hypothetical protein